jgi:hypothetical protein
MKADGLASTGASRGWIAPPIGTDDGSAYIDSRIVPVN